MENMFAMQLQSNGFKLYYYDRKKYEEIDFIVETDRNLLPIEIKSGKDYKTHASLTRVMKDIHKLKSQLYFV